MALGLGFRRRLDWSPRRRVTLLGPQWAHRCWCPWCPPCPACRGPTVGPPSGPRGPASPVWPGCSADLRVPRRPVILGPWQRALRRWPLDWLNVFLASLLLGSAVCVVWALLFWALAEKRHANQLVATPPRPPRPLHRRAGSVSMWKARRRNLLQGRHPTEGKRFEMQPMLVRPRLGASCGSHTR